ncbi:MAG: GAF domain-containing protein [Pseudomonadota bacterium]
MRQIGQLAGRKGTPLLDSVARSASRILRAPVALITVIDDTSEEQVFCGMRGSVGAFTPRRATPLSHSMCRTVRDMNAVLRVEDTRRAPRFRDNAAVGELDVIAYLGVPLVMPSTGPVGAFCVIDREPRAWSDGDVETLDALVPVAVEALLVAPFCRKAERRVLMA